MIALLPTLETLELPTDEVLGETTVNVGTLHGAAPKPTSFPRSPKPRSCSASWAIVNR